MDGWFSVEVVMSITRAKSSACFNGDPTTVAPYPHSPLNNGLLLDSNGVYCDHALLQSLLLVTFTVCMFHYLGTIMSALS